MSLIKSAQVASTLSETKKEFYTNLGKVLNKSLVEMAEEGSTTIEPVDYEEWLRVIGEVAQEQGIDLTKIAAFQDLAWEVLDNDPKMDALGADETTKNHVVNSLWHAYNTMSHHGQAVSNASRSEMEDEETTKSTTKKSGDANVMELIHNSPSLQKVYRDGMSVGKSDAQNADKKPTKCQYATGTVRCKAWVLGHKHGAIGK